MACRRRWRAGHLCDIGKPFLLRTLVPALGAVVRAGAGCIGHDGLGGLRVDLAAGLCRSQAAFLEPRLDLILEPADAAI